MDPRIRFETKEDSNARREREFMALSPSQRVEWLLRSFDDPMVTIAERDNNSRNFIIRKRSDALR